MNNKIAVFVIGVVLAAVGNSAAQRPAVLTEAPAPPPPPAPAPAKPWESVEGGFKVYFPGKPAVKVTQNDSSFGKTSITDVSLGTSLAYYSVTYIDFPTAMTDRADLDTRFDMMRDSQVKRLSARVVEDAQFSFGDHYGRSTVFETDKETISTRAFAVGPRLFMLLVVTRGRMSSSPAAIVSSSKARVGSFFNSFEITRIPEPKTQAVSLPTDFGVEASATRFHSRYFGASFTPPKGWHVVEKDLADLTMELGKEELRRSNPKLADQITNESTRVLAMYSKKPLDQAVSDAVLFVIAERAPYPNFLPEAVAKTYEKLYRDPSETVTKPPTLTTIAGRPFAWLETFDKNTKLYQRAHFANVKGIAFEIIYVFKSEADLAELKTVLDTLRVEETVEK